MATIVNARDVLLQAATTRLVGVDLPSNIHIPVDNIPALTGVTLTATSQLFQIPDASPAFPTTITLKATVRGLTALPVLSLVTGTMSITPVFDSSLEFTFSASDMTTEAVVFRATVSEPDPLGGPDVDYIDEFTILKVRDSSGVIGFLTNENVTLTADNSGNVASYTGASGHFVVLKGISDITSTCSFSVFSNPQSLTVSIGSDGAYTVSGGFASSDDNATVTFRAVTPSALNIDKTLSLSKAKRGNTGNAGSAGDKTATVYLYAWSTSQPANPNGSSSYSWTTATHSAFSGTTWGVTAGSNPGTPGIKLWVAQQTIIAAGGASSTTVTWTAAGNGTNGLPYAVYAASQNGSDGSAGLKTIEATVYRWDLSIPSGVTGSDTYDWTSNSYNGPAGTGTNWFINPPAPVPGYTLWVATKIISDVSTTNFTSFNWTGASIQSKGYAGLPGASSRTAYARLAGNPTPTSGIIHHAGDSAPTSGESAATWGISSSWSGSDPNPASTNTLYQTDGIYNPSTGYTDWATPYISSLKVGSLSAITVNTGSLTVDGTFTMTTAGMINQGPYTGYGWPSSGTGFHLGPFGLLMGNNNTGGYVEISSSGNKVDFGKTGGPRFLWDGSGAGSLTLTSASLSAGAISGTSITGGTISGTTISGNTITGGTITGTSISGGTITGAVIQTAASGTRVAINESNSNSVRLYDGITMAVYIGTGSGLGYVVSGVSGSSAAGGYFFSGSNVGVAGVSTSGVGVNGSSTNSTGVQGSSSSSYGVFASSTSGIGLFAVSSSGQAIQANGLVQTDNGFRVNVSGPKGLMYYNSGAFKLEAEGGVPLILASGGASRAEFPTSGGLQVFQGFGCNGKTPQSAQASGGTLAGVIAALVNVGILSS